MWLHLKQILARQAAIHHPRGGMRPAITAIAVIIGIAIIHALSQRSHDTTLTALSLRLFYLPVIYGAVTGGALVGLGCGLLAASLHATAMLFNGDSALMGAHGGHTQILLTEHMSESPFLLLIGGLAGWLRDQQLFERRQRMEVTRIFGRYVSPDVVNEILHKEFQLDGEEMEATILFCDLRDFTRLSETLPPVALLGVLNEYLAQMVSVVHSQHGFLDKFIGDGIMAVFGVPLRRKESAAEAVRAAVEMVRRMDRINDGLQQKGVELRMGIGVNTGAIVAGNVGCKQRMEYTVLGSPVNIASRLEGLTKVYHTPVLISEYTRAALEPGEFTLRAVDAVRAKGSGQPCMVYEVLDALPAPIRERRARALERFQLARTAYTRGEFTIATQAFTALRAEQPDDRVVNLYLERLDALRGKPVPPQWDGVFNPTTK